MHKFLKIKQVVKFKKKIKLTSNLKQREHILLSVWPTYLSSLPVTNLHCTAPSVP